MSAGSHYHKRMDSETITTPSQTWVNPTPEDAAPPLLPASYNGGALSLLQKKFLAAYLEAGSMTGALALVDNLGSARVRTWLRTDANFQAAYKELGTGLLTEARAILDGLMPQAAEAFEEAMDAERTIDVDITCPECGHEHTVKVKTADLRLRLQTAKDLLKRSGDLAAKVQVSGEVKHRDMALEDRLALAQVQRWHEVGMAKGEPCPVPPDVYDSLSKRGLLLETLPSRALETLPAGVRRLDEGPPELPLGPLVRFADTADRDSLEGEYQVLPPSQPPDR